jgi:hypothetical protein
MTERRASPHRGAATDDGQIPKRFRRCTPAGSVHLITFTSRWKYHCYAERISQIRKIRQVRCATEQMAVVRGHLESWKLIGSTGAEGLHADHGHPLLDCGHPRAVPEVSRPPLQHTQRAAAVHVIPLHASAHAKRMGSLAQCVREMSCHCSYLANCVTLAFPPVVVSPGRVDPDRREPDQSRRGTTAAQRRPPATGGA